MAVYFGNARCDENGNITGGAAGDQTGREVCIQAAYTYNWEAVYRPKRNGALVGQLMSEACANNNIGYDQGQRTTLYQQWVRAGRPGHLTSNYISAPCECDCSSLVALCLIIAGLVSEGNYSFATGTEATVLANSGNFVRHTGAGYTTGFGACCVGDVMFKHGHTAIVTDGSSPGPEPTPSEDEVTFSYAVRTTSGTIYPVVTNLTDWAGEDNEPITDITIGVDKGSIKYQVHVCGEDWLPWVTGNDWNDGNNGYAGDTEPSDLYKEGGKPIDLVRCYYYSPAGMSPLQSAQYRVRAIGNGNYYDWQFDDDTDQGQDGYAGSPGRKIDRFQIF